MILIILSIFLVWKKLGRKREGNFISSFFISFSLKREGKLRERKRENELFSVSFLFYSFLEGRYEKKETEGFSFFFHFQPLERGRERGKERGRKIPFSFISFSFWDRREKGEIKKRRDFFLFSCFFGEREEGKKKRAAKCNSLSFNIQF